MSIVQVHHEVRNGSEGRWQLCFQWVTYTYENGAREQGYRFIWRRPDGSLQPARGQARIPSSADLFELLQRAARDGWFVAAEAIEPLQAQLPLA